jgi:hypothetical protein
MFGDGIILIEPHTKKIEIGVFFRFQDTNIFSNTSAYIQNRSMYPSLLDPLSW